ncbi:PAAR domain-containing protein [Luteimonas sp. MJ146]
MARNWIVVGDPTSSGGSVITGSSFTDIDGIPVARVNDQATCPRHKGAYPIVDGDSTLVVDGQPVALHGSSLACGCKVLSAQQVRVFVDVGGGGAGGAGGLASLAAAAGVAAAVAKLRNATEGAATTGPAGEFDQGLCLVDGSGRVLCDAAYVLQLEDGSCLEGRTDDAGNTARVVTQTPQRIVKVVLNPEDVVCCPAHAHHCPESLDPLEIALEGVTTSAEGFGVSVHQVATPEGDARGLTQGEIAMSRLVFGDAIDYSKVRIHNREYLWFGLQPDNAAMAPNGHIYFNPKHFQEDFSDPASPDYQWWFMHEMTHVWQHQLGYPVKWRGALRVGLGYEYVLAADKRLSDYNMEAQGNILADYFALSFLRDVFVMRQANYRSDPDAAVLFSAVLSDFIRDPSNRKSLP